jgi:hypothetical protein
MIIRMLTYSIELKMQERMVHSDLTEALTSS